MLKLPKCLELLSLKQSKNCTGSSFRQDCKHYVAQANNKPMEKSSNWDRKKLCSGNGRRMICQDRRDTWDAPDKIEDAKLDG